ncbi:hypothetical protein [Nocardioides dubius]|uniref:hypothetical protein n=1 Tax=Nocardioides dubius TaxID=317019 RepID=UPI0031D73DA1
MNIKTAWDSHGGTYAIRSVANWTQRSILEQRNQPSRYYGASYVEPRDFTTNGIRTYRQQVSTEEQGTGRESSQPEQHRNVVSVFKFPRALVPAVCAVLLANGCSAGGSETERSKAAPSSTPQTDTGTATDTEGADTWSWRVVAQDPRTNRGYLHASKRYLLEADSSQTMRVNDRKKESPVAAVTVPPGEHLEQVDLSERWLTWVTVENSDDPSVTHWVRRLPHGSPQRIEDIAKAPRPQWPPTQALAGSLLTYTAGAMHRRCAVTLDLETGTHEKVMCVRHRKTGIGMPRLSEAGVVVNTQSEDGTPNGCNRAWVRRADDATATELPAQLPCAAFTGAVSSSTTVWNEQYDEDAPDVGAFYGLDGPEVVPLGDGDAGSEIACGDWVYWTDHAGEVGRLKRWRPGTDVEVVYRNSKRWLLVASPRCRDDRITLLQSANGQGEDQLIEALIPDE